MASSSARPGIVCEFRLLQLLSPKPLSLVQFAAVECDWPPVCQLKHDAVNDGTAERISICGGELQHRAIERTMLQEGAAPAPLRAAQDLAIARYNVTRTASMETQERLRASLFDCVRDHYNGRKRPYGLNEGFVHVTNDLAKFRMRPVIGWKHKAVRQFGSMHDGAAAGDPPHNRQFTHLNRSVPPRLEVT